MGDPTPPPGGDLSAFVAPVLALRRQMKDLSSASGTQRYRSVEKLSALIDDIQQQLDDYIQNEAYTKAQVDARIANPPAPGVSAAGDVAASGALRGQNLYATQAPGFNITGTRVAAWLESATGRLGTASSSRRYKQDEAPAGIDPSAVLTIEPKQFRYIDQVEELGDCAAVEFGFIAEDLHDAGMYPWVVYREIDGEIIPDGVNYSMLVVAQHAVLREQQSQIDALSARLDALDGGTS